MNVFSSLFEYSGTLCGSTRVTREGMVAVV